MYHLNNHPNFCYLKNHLFEMKETARDFNHFIKECQKHASDLSKTISESNPEVYGFSIFNMKWFDKKENRINLLELKNSIESKFLGDALEIFAAFFLQYFETDIVFGAKRGSYEFTNDEEDVGCDGCYINTTSQSPSFIQVKYRSNPKSHPFDYQVFSKLFTDATINYGFDWKNEKQRLVFFTNLSFGSDINAWTARTGQFNKIADKMPIKPVLVGKNEIERLTGKSNTSNKNFWDEFYKQFSL